MSLASFLAFEASGELVLEYARESKLPNVNLALDLEACLIKLFNTQKDLETSRERVEDLEDSCNEFISFIEIQKDEIARLRRGGGEVD
jgi:hypothetical protein